MFIKALAKTLIRRLEWFTLRSISEEDKIEVEKALQTAFDAGFAKGQREHCLF